MSNFLKVFGLILLLFTLTNCNFHEIHKNNYFRSAQLSGKGFDAAIKKHKIKSIINLRGKAPGSKWYEEELAASIKHGVARVDIAMSAGSIPHRENLIALLDAFRDLPRPILVHCAGGADRTGEATAIYQMLYMGASKEEAMKSQTPKYGHIEQRYPAKRYFIRELWQGEQWAREGYDPCTQDYKYYDRFNCGQQLEIDTYNAQEDIDSNSDASSYQVVY